MVLKHFLKKITGGREREQSSEQQEIKKVSVHFWDFNNNEAATNHNIDPGYYFTISPIEEADTRDPSLIPQLSSYFFQELNKHGLILESRVRIPIDNKDEAFVDPENGWEFIAYGYTKEQKIFFIKAEHVNPDDVQRYVVKSLKNK